MKTLQFAKYALCLIAGSCVAMYPSAASSGSLEHLQARRALMRRDNASAEGEAYASVRDNVGRIVSSQAFTEKNPVKSALKTTCFDSRSWYRRFKKAKKWRKYSQGHQDSVLQSLFGHLGTRNKFYVEFGFDRWFRWPLSGADSNTQLLREQGWQGLLMDGSHFNPFINLHMETITPENIVNLFRKYSVPAEPDYVSIDIDSCDLWVLLNLTVQYRPRVISIEYNSNYPLRESKTNVCVDRAGRPYKWHDDDMYGASLAAIHKGALSRDYSVVYVERRHDVFLVRRDMICSKRDVRIEAFKRHTGIKMWKEASAEEKAVWTQVY
eukprot:TRINITY_DN9309_c0_g1_i1.p1 TRINITY_DN9309_c0_g1~~TRINITY_DN9309_c0_g1_i1.p1  ORF type:complete len:324 (+),score=19.97 TRINITY_DN9309_c0_g1_i1:93-1064(+)